MNYTFLLVMNYVLIVSILWLLAARKAKRQAERTDRVVIDSVTFDMLKTDQARVARAARQPGGIRVVDEAGIERFRLVIPSTTLPD